MVLGNDHQRIGEEAERDGWRPYQTVAREPDPAGPTTRAVFRQVDTSQHADRDCGNRREADDDRAAYYRVGDAAAWNAARALRVDEKFEVGHGGQAPAERDHSNKTERTWGPV